MTTFITKEALSKLSESDCSMVVAAGIGFEIRKRSCLKLSLRNSA